MLQSTFEMLDADFFNVTQLIEIEKGAKELNLPIIRENRKLVASSNGGLSNPSCLVFNSHWVNEQAKESSRKNFSYSSPSNVERPANDEHIAFMSVLELGQLIKTKQIKSED